MRCIGDLVPGRMWYDADDGCFTYSEDGGETIRARDLPDGMKPFCIIRTLVEQGWIEKDSVVLLDRPEQCLHPDWQMRMAQTIVSLRRDMGCRLVLTTDSPLLLREIQAYAAMMNENIHHYLMERDETGQIRYVDLGTDPERIYDEMAVLSNSRRTCTAMTAMSDGGTALSKHPRRYNPPTDISWGRIIPHTISPRV